MYLQSKTQLTILQYMCVRILALVISTPSTLKLMINLPWLGTENNDLTVSLPCVVDVDGELELGASATRQSRETQKCNPNFLH